MKKPLVFLLLLLLYIIPPTQICKAFTQTEILNNKSLSSETAINNNYVVMISYVDSLSSLTHSDMEIYNISRLDNFMENTRQGKKDRVRIVKYIKDKTHMWVNKLDDLLYDGKEILDIAYDTYSNPDAFIPAQPFIFNNIVKRDYKDSTWYGACFSNKKSNSYATLISFLKSSNVYMSPRTGYRDEAVIITYGNMYHYFLKDLADKYVPWKN